MNCNWSDAIQSQNPDRAPLFVHHNLSQYIESGGKSKHCIRGKFCSQTLLSAKRQQRYIGIWLHLQASIRWGSQISCCNSADNLWGFFDTLQPELPVRQYEVNNFKRHIRVTLQLIVLWKSVNVLQLHSKYDTISGHNLRNFMHFCADLQLDKTCFVSSTL